MPKAEPDGRSTGVARKLLTILAADVADYSKAVAENEEASIAVLSDLRKVMDRAIQKHRGRIANTAGDSVIAAFESAVDALKAAIEIQSSHDEYYLSSNRPIELRFRIGINLGDVILRDDGDLLGHGVNVASRLEALASPGGICLSSSVVEQTEGKIEFDLSKLGEHYLKNIEKPVLVYSVGVRGNSKIALFRKDAEKFVRSPFFIATFSIFMVVSIFFLFWSVLREDKVIAEGLPLTPFLETDPGPQELLKKFDLVTEGSFEGSNYYVIRTWGGKLADLEKIAELLGGHMVAIGSDEENQFVYDLTIKEEGHWLVYEGQYNGPMIGLVQEEGAKEPDGGWYWLNGEPLVYTNWRPGGPDNHQGDQYLAYFKTDWGSAPSPHWNDTRSVGHSFVVEVPEN